MSEYSRHEFEKMMDSLKGKYSPDDSVFYIGQDNAEL